jgi:hypothetical protein
MQNAEICGVEYQQGELASYGRRQYVLAKFGYRCVYCHKTNVPLQLDHLLPLETGSGGRTKWNRRLRSTPKTHWLDATCVGASTPEQIRWQVVVPLAITALGRHNRQMVNATEHGFPRGKPKATSVVSRFRSGDLVRAVVPAPLKTAGVHVGTISVRATGSCDVTTKHRRVGGVSIRYCRPLQKLDGYRYAQGSRAGASSVV